MWAHSDHQQWVACSPRWDHGRLPLRLPVRDCRCHPLQIQGCVGSSLTADVCAPSAHWGRATGTHLCSCRGWAAFCFASSLMAHPAGSDGLFIQFNGDSASSPLPPALHPTLPARDDVTVCPSLFLLPCCLLSRRRFLHRSHPQLMPLMGSTLLHLQGRVFASESRHWMLYPCSITVRSKNHSSFWDAVKLQVLQPSAWDLLECMGMPRGGVIYTDGLAKQWIV